MLLLKQSTSIEVAIGPFLDDTDGKTAETGLTLSQADIRLKKGAGDWAQSNDSGGATHEENGWYRITLDATDTNTLGQLRVAIHESGALPVWLDFMVLPAVVFDSLVGGSDNLQVHAVEISNNLITAAAIADGAIDAATFAAGAIDASAIAANAIGASELAADAVTEIQSGLSVLTQADVRTAVGLASANLDTQLDALPTNAELATALAAADDAVLVQVALVKAKTDNLPSDPADESLIEAAITAAQVAIIAQVDANEAKIDIVDGVVDAIKLKTDLIPADPADASDVAAGIAGLDAKLDTIDNFVDTEILAIKAKTDLIPAAPAAVGDIPTAAAIADAVWDEAIAGHAAAGSTGEALSNAGAGGTPPTVGAIADGVWDELLSGHVTAGSAGKTLADILVDTAGIGAAEITVTSPVADGGDVSMIAGYDYTDEAERALEWESDSWPDLTGATVNVVKPELDDEDPAEEISYDWTVTIEDAGEATQRVKAEVTGAQTAELGDPGRVAKKRFRVKATLANSAQVVLVDATMTIT